MTSKIADLDTILLLAIDGWTNYKKNKVTNVSILNPKMKHTYYWTSFENEDDFNTAEWNSNKLIPLIKNLLEKGFV